MFISFALTVRMFMGDRHRVSSFCQRHSDNHRLSISRLLVLTFARFLAEDFPNSQNPLRIRSIYVYSSFFQTSSFSQQNVRTGHDSIYENLSRGTLWCSRRVEHTVLGRVVRGSERVEGNRPHGLKCIHATQVQLLIFSN